MSDDVSGAADDATEADDASEGGAKKPAVLLAKAVWHDQLKERGLDPKDKKASTEDWKANKKQYVSLSRRILKRLERQGYSLTPKAAE